MRRAGQKGTVSRLTTSATPTVNENARGSGVVDREICTSAAASAPRVGLPADEVIDMDDRSIRRRKLLAAIQKRIETRLPGRVRNLAVRTFGETVVLEGECATYYTKQLAQHAALGILEDEHLENAIVVNVPR